MEESEQTARVQFSRFQIPGFSLPLEFAPNEIAGNGGDLLSNALGIDSIFGGVSAELVVSCWDIPRGLFDIVGICTSNCASFFFFKNAVDYDSRTHDAPVDE